MHQKTSCDFRNHFVPLLSYKFSAIIAYFPVTSFLQRSWITTCFWKVLGLWILQEFLTNRASWGFQNGLISNLSIPTLSFLPDDQYLTLGQLLISPEIRPFTKLHPHVLWIDLFFVCLLAYFSFFFSPLMACWVNSLQMESIIFTTFLYWPPYIPPRCLWTSNPHGFYKIIKDTFISPGLWCQLNLYWHSPEKDNLLSLFFYYFVLFFCCLMNFNCCTHSVFWTALSIKTVNNQITQVILTYHYRTQLSIIPMEVLVNQNRHECNIQVAKLNHPISLSTSRGITRLNQAKITT